MKIYKTHKDKTIEMYYKGRNLALRFKEGGELPEELAGLFTNINEAERGIITYLDKHTPKHKKPTVTPEEEEAIKEQNRK